MPIRQSEGVRSVHFPGTSAAPARDPQPASKPATANALEVFANTHRDIDLVRDKLRNLLASTSRHGDLQAALSASLRLSENLRLLIENEEL